MFLFFLPKCLQSCERLERQRMRIDWLIEQDIICLCLFHLSLFSSLKVIKRNDLFMREVEGVESRSISTVEAFFTFLF